LHCSPTQAGQTLLGLAIPRRSGSLWSHRVGCRLPGPPLVWCRVRWLGWAGWAWPEGLSPTGAGRGVQGPPASPRAARPSIRPVRSPGRDRVACSGGRQ
jgi:hypothetical protein